MRVAGAAKGRLAAAKVRQAEKVEVSKAVRICCRCSAHCSPALQHLAYTALPKPHTLTHTQSLDNTLSAGLSVSIRQSMSKQHSSNANAQTNSSLNTFRLTTVIIPLMPEIMPEDDVVIFGGQEKDTGTRGL